MASTVPQRAGGDGCAAKAGVGLIPHGQPQKKRKLPCDSSKVSGLTGKTEEDQQDSTAKAPQNKKQKQKQQRKKKRSKRRTKWSVEPGLSVVRKAIFLFRNGVGNSVQIERLLQVPARTLRRYVAESMDPTSKLFYMPETLHERRGRELQEAGERHGVYSRKSFEAAVMYAQPGRASLGGFGAGIPTPSVQKEVVKLTEETSKCHLPRLQRAPSLSGLLPEAALDLAAPASAPKEAAVVDDLSLDLDGALDMLESSFQTRSATTPQRSAPADLDFGMLDYFNDLSSSAGGGGLDFDDGSLSPFSGLSPFEGSLSGRQRSISIGDILDEISDLPVPAELNFSPRDTGQQQEQVIAPVRHLDEDAKRDNATSDALLSRAWKEQRKQLVVQPGWCYEAADGRNGLSKVAKHFTLGVGSTQSCASLVCGIMGANVVTGQETATYPDSKKLEIGADRSTIAKGVLATRDLTVLRGLVVQNELRRKLEKKRFRDERRRKKIAERRLKKANLRELKRMQRRHSCADVAIKAKGH